jgi:hypothetical protein
MFIKLNKFKVSLVLILLFFRGTSLFSQTYVNREWQTNNGNPLLTQWSSSIISQINDELITVGNTNVTGQGANILLTRYDSEGNIVWSTNYNTSSTKNDFGAAITEDSNGNIYVCGTTDNNSITNYDIIVLKYKSNGTLLWDTTYNSSAGKNDIAVSIQLDVNGCIYVGASSEGATTQFDFLTLKYNPNGTLSWASRYDYANLNEYAVGLTVRSGDIIIIGASASTSANWDYTSVKYNLSNGNQLGISRDSVTGAGFDQPTSFKKDNYGNIYATGKGSTNGIDYDLKTIKINANLGLVWNVTQNGYNKEDQGNTIAIDGNDNIIVGGYNTKANNVKEAIAIKYDSSGAYLWRYLRTSDDSTGDASVIAVDINLENEIYLGIQIKGLNGTNDIAIVKLSDDGEIIWERRIHSLINEIPTGLKVSDDGTIYITYVQDIGGSASTYTVEKYSEHEISKVSIYQNGRPICRKNELIVKFDQSALILAPFTTTNTTFGRANEFIDSNILSMMDNKMNMYGNLADAFVHKIYSNLTITDSITMDRFGNPNYIPKFWTEFVLELPRRELDYSLDELKEYCDSLNTIHPGLHYAILNSIIEFDGHDPIYDTSYVNYKAQNNLHDANGIFPNSNINYEASLSKGIYGSPYTRIGIFDDGIMQDHEDLKNGLISCVKGGYNYDNDAPLSNTSPNYINGHGTAVAGIIAAIRNNNKGIAGIAGRNENISSSHQGVSLYNQVISTMENVYAAIVDGSVDTIFESKFDINNFCWGTSFNNDPLEKSALRDKIRFSFKQGITQICSRGNYGQGFTNGVSSVSGDHIHYPANFYDDWIISVGASANDGKFKYFGNSSAYFPSDSICSSWGHNIDFLAPGSADILTTTAVDMSNTAIKNKYGYFMATSASAPHATALAALLIDYAKSPLAPEDIEHLIEYSCDDLNDTLTIYDILGTPLPSENIGYDNRTGWGRINIGNALNMIDSPKWVFQVNIDLPPIPNFSDTLFSYYFNDDFEDENGDYHYAGYYDVIKETYNSTVLHNFSNGAYVIESTGKPGIWPRNSYSNLWGSGDYIPETNQKIISYSIDSATIEAYRYRLLKCTNLPPLLGYGDYPSKPYATKLDPNGNVRLGYSIYVYDTSLTSIPSITKDTFRANQSFFLSPNPTSNTSSIEFDANSSGKYTLNLYSLDGKVIKIIQGKYNSGRNKILIDISSEANSIYFVDIHLDNKKAQTLRLLKY